MTAPPQPPSRWLRRQAPGGRDAHLLLAARVLMSGERALVSVVVPIYLARIGYSASKLAVMFAIVALASAVMSLLVGLWSDRVGRRPFVIALPLAAAAAAVVFMFTDHTVLLFAFAALGSFGRGSGAGSGAVGPYQPAEQALMAGTVGDRGRNRLFGLVASASAAGGLLGAVLAAEIRSALAAVAGSVDYTYRHPSRRGGATPDVVLPSMIRPVPEVAVVCDTSGSMHELLLARALAEVEGLLTRAGLRSGRLRVLPSTPRCTRCAR